MDAEVYKSMREFKSAAIRFLLAWPLCYGPSIEHQVHWMEYGKAERN